VLCVAVPPAALGLRLVVFRGLPLQAAAARFVGGVAGGIAQGAAGAGGRHAVAQRDDPSMAVLVGFVGGVAGEGGLDALAVGKLR